MSDNTGSIHAGGQAMTAEEFQAWLAEVQQQMTEEEAEATAREQEMEPTRPLTPTELLAAMMAAQPSIVESMPDETVGRMQPYLAAWDSTATYATGDLVTYGEGDGDVYRCLQDHTAQDTWNPADASSLWAKVLTSEDEILPWVQPDSTNPYMAGDRVTHNGSTWESTIDNNVWEPGVYGWEVVS